MTTHCWGEKAAGDWILEIYDSPSQVRSQKAPGSQSDFYNYKQENGTRVATDLCFCVCPTSYRQTEGVVIGALWYLGAPIFLSQ